MSSPFSRSLRALESESSRGWLPAAVVACLILAWAAWFFIARVPLYETSEMARIEAAAAAHPVDARIAGRVIRVQLAVGRPVRAGDVLVELEADAEALALEEARARFDALKPEILAVGREIAAEERAIADDERAAGVARDEQRAILRETQAALGLADEEANRSRRLRADGIIPELEDARARAEAARRLASADAAGAALARIEHDQKTRVSDRLVRIQRLRGTMARLDGEAGPDRNRAPADVAGARLDPVRAALAARSAAAS